MIQLFNFARTGQAKKNPEKNYRAHFLFYSP